MQADLSDLQSSTKRANLGVTNVPVQLSGQAPVQGSEYTTPSVDNEKKNLLKNVQFNKN